MTHELVEVRVHNAALSLVTTKDGDALSVRLGEKEREREEEMRIEGQERKSVRKGEGVRSKQTQKSRETENE